MSNEGPSENAVAAMESSERAEVDPWHLNEIARQRRVCIDAERSLGANLSEGLALIEFLSGFTGVCRR